MISHYYDKNIIMDTAKITHAIVLYFLFLLKHLDYAILGVLAYKDLIWP